MDDLKATVEALSARVEALQADNAALRAAIGQMNSAHRVTGHRVPARSAQARAGEGDVVGRRRLLSTAIGVAAAGAAGAALFDAAPASAATGDNLILGTSNSAGTHTDLTCTDNTTTALWVLDGNSSGMSYTAAVLGDTDTQNGVAGLTSADGVGVYGVSHARSNLGYFPAGVFGDSDTHPGVWGQSSSQAGVFGQSPGVGVSGVTTDTTYGVGVYGNAPGVNASGVQGDSTHGIGVHGQSTNGTGVYGAGRTGVSALGYTSLPGNVGLSALANTAIKASAHGATGQALVASAASSRAAVQVTNTGTGPGAVLQGGAAQLQLVPGKRSTHPASGTRGDLYADSTGRLWFCKTSGAKATWRQIA